MIAQQVTSDHRKIFSIVVVWVIHSILTKSISIIKHQPFTLIAPSQSCYCPILSSLCITVTEGRWPAEQKLACLCGAVFLNASCSEIFDDVTIKMGEGPEKKGVLLSGTGVFSHPRGVVVVTAGQLHSRAGGPGVRVHLPTLCAGRAEGRDADANQTRKSQSHV